MAEPKTRPTDTDVEAFLAAVPDERRRADAVTVDAIMREVTGEQPVVWGTSIVGYGETALEGARGATTPWPVVAFAPRKAELVLYLNTQLDDDAFADLGPHRRGKGCLYVKRVDAVDHDVLRALIARSVELARS